MADRGAHPGLIAARVQVLHELASGLVEQRNDAGMAGWDSVLGSVDELGVKVLDELAQFVPLHSTVSAGVQTSNDLLAQLEFLGRTWACVGMEWISGALWPVVVSPSVFHIEVSWLGRRVAGRACRQLAQEAKRSTT